MTTSILNTIKADQLTARKDRIAEKAKFLSLLISDISMIGKNAGGREPTEMEAAAMVKKYMKNVRETIGLLEKDSTKDVALKQLNEELNWLNMYLPKAPDQIGTDTIDAEFLGLIVASSIAGQDVPTTKTLLSHLSAKFPGQYNGKIAFERAKEAVVLEETRRKKINESVEA